jgi:hypothetical protein
MLIMPHRASEEYFKRLQDALLAAVLDVSRDPETKVVVVHPGELISSCINLISTFAAQSSGVDSPEKLRQFSEGCADRIERNIARAQEMARAGELPIATIRADRRH